MTGKTISIEKKTLRKKYLEIRSSMKPDEVISKSKIIHNHLFASEHFSNAKTVHTYVSMAHRNEVDTYDVIQFLHDAGKMVFVPKMEANSTLTHFELRNLNELNENEWGVMEPLNSEKADFKKADIVIVPMVSGDNHKNRLGYGKGYYDRFLKQVDSIKIGLLFNLQIHHKILPVYSFDVPLDMLITESGVIL